MTPEQKAVDPIPPCDVCGQPATSAARDTMRHETWGADYVEFRPVGKPRYGCDQHPA